MQYLSESSLTWSKMSTPLKVFLSLFVMFGILLGIVGLVWLVTWIKYSLIKNDNSRNYTGAKMAEVYLERYGVEAPRIKFRGLTQGHVTNVHVESKILFLNPYVIRNNQLVLRLLPWTYHRRSIYTLAMALERAWAVSSTKSTKFNTFWWEFGRKIALLVIFLPFIFALLLAFKFITIFSTLNTNTWVIILSILWSVFLIIFISSQVFFYGQISKEITQSLHGMLNPDEIKAIAWIYKVKFVYYIIYLIYEVLWFIVKLIFYFYDKRD